MNRYEFVRQMRDETKLVFNSTKLPVIPKSDLDKYIFTREGDRLDLLAVEFYNDARHWIILALANNLGKGTMIVPAGIQLRIPEESVITSYKDIFSKAESER